MIDRSCLFSDPDPLQPDCPPNTFAVFIPGARGRLRGTVYVPGGSGVHPVILFCHGIPGTERLLDFCLALRRVGFCTVQFHYSGCWGSDGDYAIGHCMEDVDAVLAYLLRNEQGLFDLTRLYIAGHSMGGLMACYALAKFDVFKAGAVLMPADMGGFYLSAQTNPAAAPAIREMFDHDFGDWLQNFSWETFCREAALDVDRFRLAHYAQALVHKPLLAIAGTRDTDIPRAEHLDLLTSSIQTAGGKQLTVRSFVTDHAMNEERLAIQRALANFFAACAGQ